MGGRRYGGGGRGRLYTYRYTVTTRMTPALKGLAHADYADFFFVFFLFCFFCINFYCFMFDYYVALISALVLLNCGDLRITVVV